MMYFFTLFAPLIIEGIKKGRVRFSGIVVSKAVPGTKRIHELTRPLLVKANSQHNEPASAPARSDSIEAHRH